MRQNKNESGFIPMLVIIVLALGVVIWLSYRHVNDAHKKQILQKASQYENSLNK